MKIRILLIDDHPVVRAGLRAILETEADLEVVGEADGGVRAISSARKLRPDIVVTDLLLPDLDGLAVTRSIRAELPETQVIILTGVSHQLDRLSDRMRGTGARTAPLLNLHQRRPRLASWSPT